MLSYSLGEIKNHKWHLQVPSERNLALFSTLGQRAHRRAGLADRPNCRQHYQMSQGCFFNYHAIRGVKRYHWGTKSLIVASAPPEAAMLICGWLTMQWMASSYFLLCTLKVCSASNLRISQSLTVASWLHEKNSLRLESIASPITESSWAIKLWVIRLLSKTRIILSS